MYNSIKLSDQSNICKIAHRLLKIQIIEESSGIKLYLAFSDFGSLKSIEERPVQLHNKRLPKMKLKSQFSKSVNEYPSLIAASPLNTTFAVGLASGNIDFHEAGSQKLLKRIAPQTANSVISDLKFDTQNQSLLWSSNQNGEVLLYDLRDESIAMKFQCTAPILSFDINCTNTQLAAGTEQVRTDAYIYFYDIRAVSELCRFEECHSDDVTQIKYHPTQNTAMISGSTDGLLCLYNLETFDEDDALYQVIKEDSISQIGYFGAANEFIYCSTHIETLSLWAFQDSNSIKSFGDVRGAYSDFEFNYCIGWTFDPTSGRLFVQGGSYE